jgi:hypothetical protein
MGNVAVGLTTEYLHARVMIANVYPYIGENMALVGRDVIDMVYLDGPHQGEHVTTYRVA